MMMMLVAGGVCLCVCVGGDIHTCPHTHTGGEI